MPLPLPSDIKIGSKHETNSSGTLTVLDVIDSYDIKVKFDKTGYETTVSAGNIRKGSVKDKNKPVVCGVGFIGDGKFFATKKGKRDPAYRAWTNMLFRCFSDDYKSRQPTYMKCTVDESWLSYQVFAKWFYENNKGEKYQLDKDLIIHGNKHYSPETCALVPQWLNLFTVARGADRGDYPIGVSFSKQKNKFEAYCNENAKRKQLGFYESPETAHQAWKKYKLGLALERKHEMDEIDTRIYPNVVKIIESAR